MAKTMKTKLGAKEPVQIPAPWASFLRKKRARNGVAMWRNVTAALEEKFAGEPDAPKRTVGVSEEG